MKKLLWLAFSGLIPMCTLFGALYLFDPLQIFHKPYWRENFFARDMRDQAYGIISNYNFDSLILGSSILQNTSSFEAKQKLSGNGSISQSLVAICRKDWLLSRKPLKNIKLKMLFFLLVGMR